jgi:hypothetical protein
MYSVKNDFSRTPLIRTLIIRIANYSDRLGLSGKFASNSTKRNWKLPVIGSSKVQYSTLLWLIELQIRRGRNV